MTCSDDTISQRRAELRRRAVGDALDAIETEGLPGLVKTMYRMIGPNQPSIDCLRGAEQPFGADAPDGGKNGGGEGAGEILGDETWDAAVDMAKCLRGARLDRKPDPPEPPENPPPPPPQVPPRGLNDSVADIVLAALLVRLRGEERRKRGDPARPRGA